MPQVSGTKASSGRGDGCEASFPSHHAPLHGKRCLLDGDILAYRCGFAAEKTRYLVDGVIYEDHKSIPKDTPKLAIWSQREIQPVEFALQALKTTLDWIHDVSKPSGTQVYLTGRNNFRYDVAVTRPYKGNRETQGKPTHYRACINYLKEIYGAVTTDGYEADDAIGIDVGKLGESCFVCTIDKDMDQLPGWKFNWVDDLVYRTSRRAGDFALYRQILAGDSTDNVPGLGGIGNGRASKLLDGCTSSTELFARSWGAYRAGISPPERAWEYFVEQARLVYILRGESDIGQIPEFCRTKPSDVVGAT